MASASRTLPPLGQLYIKQTTPRVDEGSNVVTLPGALDIVGNVSVTSQFKVSMHLSSGGGPNPLMQRLTSTGLLNNTIDVLSYDFLCSDASLPGVTLNYGTESGSFQGVDETFPTHKVFTPFTIEFYVDKEFKIIRIFEEWINFINPIYKGTGVEYTPTDTGASNYIDSDDFFRLKYPEDYRKIISVTKFEREFRDQDRPRELKSNPNTVTYRMIDAYPTNISPIPVTYRGSEVTKTTVTFNYSRYVLTYNVREPKKS